MPANSQNSHNITKAFEPDYLNRKALVEEWTSALLSTKINHHLVISVSGDWGTGKTYLAKNWHKYLEEQEYFTCYIDAHKKDYAEDPLLIIMSEIENAVNKYMKAENGAIKEAFDKVKDSFLPFLVSGFKTVAKVGAGVLLPDIISSNISKIIDNIDGEKLKEIIKGSIDEYNNKKDSIIEEYYDNIKAYSENIEEFKQALEKFANTIADKLKKPVVIFIDELDRSNPKFVIKLIEQLKHIFEIPNLVFILTVNKKELSNTIEGIYGSKMDGYAYYKKFTTHDFTLYPIEQLNDKNLKTFIEETINKYNDFKMSDDFISIAVKIVQLLNLSLRDIEQVLDHLYYIKEKVTQEYNKEYLIICFLYRAMYIQDYSLFMFYKNHFEDLERGTIIKNGKYDDGNFVRTTFYRVLYNYLNPSSSVHIQRIMTYICIQLDSEFYENLSNKPSTVRGERVYCLDEIYPNIIDLYKPLFLHANSSIENNAYYSINDLKASANLIRKNLIQLSMLGAVPKDNIV